MHVAPPRACHDARRPAHVRGPRPEWRFARGRPHDVYIVACASRVCKTSARLAGHATQAFYGNQRGLWTILRFSVRRPTTVGTAGITWCLIASYIRPVFADRAHVFALRGSGVPRSICPALATSHTYNGNVLYGPVSISSNSQSPICRLRLCPVLPFWALSSQRKCAENKSFSFFFTKVAASLVA